MSYTLPEAARHLGVNVRALRQAVRRGTLPAAAHLGALATLSEEWLQGAKSTIAAKKLPAREQKVPPFARYEGTSAFRQYPVRVREFNEFKAKQAG